MNFHFTDEFTEVQTQLSRADTKASILTGLSLAALTGGTALAAKAHLHGLAVAAAVLTAMLISAALVLLGLAIRPALRGDYGFVRWAATPDHDALRRQLSDLPSISDERDDCARQLWQLAQSARRKYQRIRRAIDLLGLALVCAALTAALAGLGW